MNDRSGAIYSLVSVCDAQLRRVVALGTLTAVGGLTPCQAPTPAQTPTPPVTPPAPKPKDVTLSGYADLYYQHDFGQSHGTGSVNGRWYDTTRDAYVLSALQVDIAHAPTSQRSPFGFFVSLLAGPSAETLASTEPGGINKYKTFAQAYATYLAPTKMPLTFDFGKWYAFVGYEGLDSRTQDNYSRSFTFTALEPDYMTGLRATATLNSKLTANGYLYQGYNEVQNSNSTTMEGLGATYAFTDKLSGTFQGWYGKESNSVMNQSGTFGGIGFPTPGESWVTQGNLVFIYQANSRDKFAFDGTEASATRKGNWIGGALYYRRVQDSHNAFCLRVERADDPDGIRFLAGSLLLHSVTATYDYTVNKYLTLRFELRHDIADHPFFNSDSGPTTQRTTLAFAQIFKF